MTELKPFSPASPLRIWADLKTGPQWTLSFWLDDPMGAVQDSISPGKWTKWDRADELWKTTCFEAFWGVPGEKSYWELNVSPGSQLWSLYRFDDYRKPQPPQHSEDFQLKDISTTMDKLTCVLTPNTKLQKIEFSLTAVLRTEKLTHYFAFHHAGSKADFHLRESFKGRA